MIERWLPVVGFEGIYEVSDQGQVKAVERTRPDGRHFREKILATYNLGGYVGVSLYRGKIGRPRHVHRLVAEAFLGPCPPGHETNHRDGNKQNPWLYNLEWATKSENQLHAVRNGLRPRVTKGAFRKGNKPWNTGKVTGQKPWNYNPYRHCTECGVQDRFFCRQMCEPCYRRWRYQEEKKRYLAEQHLLISGNGTDRP